MRKTDLSVEGAGWVREGSGMPAKVFVGSEHFVSAAQMKIEFVVDGNFCTVGLERTDHTPCFPCWTCHVGFVSG